MSDSKRTRVVLDLPKSDGFVRAMAMVSGMTEEERTKLRRVDGEVAMVLLRLAKKKPDAVAFCLRSLTFE